jgi:hypothetical protein
MNRIMRLTTSVIAASIAIIVLSTSLLAQEGKSDAAKKAEAEMKAAFGTVPVMMKVYPDHLRGTAWDWSGVTDSM